MYIKFKNKINIILGRLNVSQKSLKIFDNRVIDFLDEISIEIKRSKSAKRKSKASLRSTDRSRRTCFYG